MRIYKSPWTQAPATKSTKAPLTNVAGLFDVPALKNRRRFPRTAKPSQAQKHVTHNEAIRALDAILQLTVVSRSVSSPPASPAGGDRYIVPAGATGSWSGKANKVAAWQDGAWVVYTPREGWLAYVIDENRMLAFKDETVRDYRVHRIGTSTTGAQHAS